MKKVILWDFDGVLVNTFHFCYEISSSLRDDVKNEDDYRRFFYGNIFDNFNKPTTFARKENEGELFFEKYIPKLMQEDPVPGMVEVLKTFSSEEMAIVSSTINSPIEDYVKKHEISGYFKKIYGADVHTSKIKKIEMALDNFRAKPEQCIFITDTLGDIIEARKVGVQSVGVTWGFHKIEDLQKGNPLVIVNTPKELEIWLLNFINT